MNRCKIRLLFIVMITGLMLSLALLSVSPGVATHTALAAQQGPIIIFPPPNPSVNGDWKFSANLFTGSISFAQIGDPGSFTGQIDINKFDCFSSGEPLSLVTGSVQRPNEFSPTTISFRRTRSFPPLTQEYTGTVLFRAVRPEETRAVGMFGTFRQLDPPISGNFPWYAVRD